MCHVCREICKVERCNNEIEFLSFHYHVLSKFNSVDVVPICISFVLQGIYAVSVQGVQTPVLETTWCCFKYRVCKVVSVQGVQTTVLETYSKF